MSDNQSYAGIDIGATNIKYGLFDAAGTVVYRDQKPAMVEKGSKPLLHLITNIAENLLLRAAEEDLQINWLGVGSPGVVDNLTGIIKDRCPNIPDWEGMELGSYLRDHLNLDVYVDNDANAMALGELRFGAGRRFNSAVCVTVGTGIGGGIILDKQLWRGSTFSGGEIGHIVIDYNGPQCRCGNWGCLETFCSSSAMLDRTKKMFKGGMSDVFSDVLNGNEDNLTIKKIFAAAKKGDETARKVIEESATILGAGLSGVINLINPEALILGGGIIEGGAGFIESVGAEIRRRAYLTATENLRVLKAELGNDAGFIGAGLLGEYKSKRG